MKDSELKIIIAFLFNRSGKEEISPSELYLPLSMELKWFNPNQAKELIYSAIKANLLIEKGSGLKPTFNYKEINVPIGFHPSEDVLKEEQIEEKIEEKERDILKKIIEKIVIKTNISEQDLVEKINKIAEKKNIAKELAALMLSKEHNINVDDFLDEIEKSLFKENIG